MALIVDPMLKGKIALECFRKFCKIGVSCLSEDGMQRHFSMNYVILELEFALQLQENAEQCKNAGIVTLPSELMKKEEISDK